MPIIVPKKRETPKPRRVGLNKNQSTPTLLKIIGNQRTHVSSSNSIKTKNQVGVSEMSQTMKIKEPKSIDAPPVSSDEEEDEFPSQDAYCNSNNSESDVAQGRRGDIKQTSFSKTQPLQTSNNNRNLRNRPDSSSSGKLGSRYQDDEPSSSAGSKRAAEDPAPSTGSHLTDALGFTATKKRKAAKAKYGTKPSQPKSSRLNPSRKSMPRSSAPRDRAETGFKRFDLSSSPEGARSTQAKAFVMPDSLSPEKARSSKAFIKPPSSTDSTPSRDQKPIFQKHDLLSDDSPVKGKSKLLDFDKGRSAKAKRNKTRTKARSDSPESVEEESSEKPTFKLHTLGDMDDLGNSDDEITTTSKNEISDDEAGDISIEGSSVTTARCPMCHEVVDEELLKKFSDNGRMNIRKQAQFCRLHKRHTAVDSGSQNGYPKINWKTINTRCENHHDFLRDILEGTQQSHYRNILGEKVESGQNRTLLKTQDSLTPGYYGPRGLRAMTEYIMRTLSSVVRKRAIEDRLVSARGYTGYVQAVLVPELAVRLIMEDMSVVEEDARKIMHDSVDVGELLYEDVGDVIAGLSDVED